MIKNKIFKHFFVEFFKIFVLITASLSILIWITQAARLLELVTEYGNSLETYSKYLIYIYPKTLDNILLLSFCVSILFLLNKMENSKELNIYWLSGISKNKIINLILLITWIIIIFKFLLSTFIAPSSSLKGREILGNAKFSMINALVKENNFNSPLKGLTIYVEKNDQKGNLENIFIYEKTRTIIAKKARVLKSNNEVYLQLLDGITQEKNKENINLINFKSTTFDFSNYQLQNVSYPKFSERDIFWLFKNYNSNMAKVNEIREEINKRIASPFFLLILSIVCCYLLCANNEKYNLKRYRLLVYFSAFFLIIINQAIVGIGGEEIYFPIIYFFLIIGSFGGLLVILKKIIHNQAI